MCAFAETFIVSLPARVASLWFPSDEISTATSIGVFGNQLGVALSFMIPTYIVTGPVVKSNETYDFYPGKFLDISVVGKGSSKKREVGNFSFGKFEMKLERIKLKNFQLRSVLSN